jgi:hypothetical protein
VNATPDTKMLMPLDGGYMAHDQAESTSESTTSFSGSTQSPQPGKENQPAKEKLSESSPFSPAFVLATIPQSLAACGGNLVSISA